MVFVALFIILLYIVAILIEICIVVFFFLT